MAGHHFQLERGPAERPRAFDGRCDQLAADAATSPGRANVELFQDSGSPPVFQAEQTRDVGHTDDCGFCFSDQEEAGSRRICQFSEHFAKICDYVRNVMLIELRGLQFDNGFYVVGR